jgi:hypothetical protein
MPKSFERTILKLCSKLINKNWYISNGIRNTLGSLTMIRIFKHFQTLFSTLRYQLFLYVISSFLLFSLKYCYLTFLYFLDIWIAFVTRNKFVNVAFSFYGKKTIKLNWSTKNVSLISLQSNLVYTKLFLWATKSHLATSNTLKENKKYDEI